MNRRVPPGHLRAALASLVLALTLPGLACSRAPRFDAPEPRLRWLWQGYSAQYLHEDGYVPDPSRDGGLVTSEAQSYALLQALWLGEREIFDRVLGWTRAQLRRDDGLHSWLWNPRTGRIDDANTATDADVDIAFALAVASVAFDDAAYAVEARAIARAIRRHARLDVGDGWVVSAGNWAGAERVTNLSYFAPYAYEYFDRLDPDGGWQEAVTTGYDLLERALARPRAPLPEDFVRVTAAGDIEPLPAWSTLGRLFSFDAIRILWRVELDCRLTRRPRACAASNRMVEVLASLAKRDRGFYAAYDAEGIARSTIRSTSFYGAFLPAFARTRPSVAAAWRGAPLSDGELAVVRAAGNRYYDANWAWFGLALADGVIAARTPPPSALASLD
jgi:endo-1,4-beta-D-glucanase Y